MTCKLKTDITTMTSAEHAKILQDENAKLKAVLRKLIASFPEMDTDDPINGANAVDILSGMWDEIKEAAN